MSAPTPTTRPFPGWLKVLCSVAVVGHLAAIGLLALAAQSGPWPVPPPFPVRESMVDGPQFAAQITSKYTIPYYLRPLRMTHNYHFASNRTPHVAVYFEAHLKDEAGKETVLKFPDDKAFWWVRHRQELLAQNLVQDQQRPPVGTQPVAPADKLPKFQVWMPVEQQPKLELKTVTDLDLKPAQPYDQPSAWMLLVADSFGRYLMREHKAVSVELVRCSRATVGPTMLMVLEQKREEQLKDGFTEMKAYFGEKRRE